MSSLQQRVAVQLQKLEAEGVLLSSYGNHKGAGTLCSVSDHHSRKAYGKLLDLAGIALAMRDIPSFVCHTEAIALTIRSYALRHQLELWRAGRCQSDAHRHISNGDMIMAMMLSGFAYTFRDNEAGPPGVNCFFNARLAE